MRIQAITLFAPLTWPFDPMILVTAGHFLRSARERLVEAGYEVESLRLAMPPFMDLLGAPDLDALQALAGEMETQAEAHQVDYVSIGPVIATTPRSFLRPIQYLPDIIATHKRIVSSVLVAASNSGLNLAAIEATAQAIHQLGQNTDQGLGNLRFGMLANVEPCGPFFPGSYHDGEQPTFGLAVDIAHLAMLAIKNARTIEQAQTNMIQGLNYHLDQLYNLVEDLVDEHHLHFSGLDLSLTPYSAQAAPLAGAMEHLGVENLGSHGTVFAVAFITNCIHHVSFPNVGYCGMMFPFLENLALSQRVKQGSFTVNDLLLYAAVYGNGLDAVPIPGETSPDQIASLLLDVATLSMTLKRPLVARLIPVPGLVAGQRTAFDLAEVADSVIMPLKQSVSDSFFQNSPFMQFL